MSLKAGTGMIYRTPRLTPRRESELELVRHVAASVVRCDYRFLAVPARVVGNGSVEAVLVPACSLVGLMVGGG